MNFLCKLSRRTDSDGIFQLAGLWKAQGCARRRKKQKGQVCRRSRITSETPGRPFSLARQAPGSGWMRSLPCRSPRCMPVSGSWRRPWRACRCTCTATQAAERRRRKAMDHPLYKILYRQPNPEMTSFHLPGDDDDPPAPVGQRLCADHPGWEEHRTGAVSAAPGKRGGRPG